MTLDSFYGKIQEKDDEYYLQFNLVICGLDSVEARRWINATLVNLVDPENPESLKPLIDGGTEGSSFHIPIDAFSDLSQRIQGTGAGYLTHNNVLLRVLPRHAQQAHRIPYLHDRKYTPTP
jgi:molybdopterin/thiamine biosynthesis adenylyltransferase